MSEPVEQGWQWAELDPLTRSVVAAFSWRIGDESQGDISGDAFIGAMTETFDDMTTEDVTKTAGWRGPDGMRNTIVNKLSGFEDRPVLSMAQQLGRLAGGSEAVIELASQAAEQLTSNRGYKAIPAIRVLSEIAVSLR